MALPPPSLIFYREKFHGRQGVGRQNEKLRKKCPANAWQALFRQKKLRLAQQVSNSLPSVGSTKPRRGFGGICGPYGASRARLRPLARLAPPCGRCWAIRGTAPVKRRHSTPNGLDLRSARPFWPTQAIAWQRQVRATGRASPAAGGREPDRGRLGTHRTVNSLLTFQEQKHPHSGEWFHHSWKGFVFALF